MTGPASSAENAAGGAARRYGPLVAILVVILLIAFAVTRTSQPGTGTSNVGGTAPGGDDASRPISFSEAKERNLAVTFGSGCDQTRGRIAIPTAFAPECFAQRANNGGATSQGVTADTIKIVLFENGPDPLISQILAAIGVTDTAEQARATLNGYVEIYQRYFELYGRKVEIIPYVSTASAADPTAARADAVRIAEDIKPFAVLGGPLLTTDFADELAARKIINFTLFTAKPAQFLLDRAPYLYTVLQAPDFASLQGADYISRKLANRPAVFAGDAALAAKNRTFGLVFLALPGGESEALVKEFEKQLADRGVKLEMVLGTTDPTATQAQQVARLKEAGVTSVIFVGDPLSPGNLTREATRQDYNPEWIITGGTLVDSTVFARTYDQKQWKHAFGISQLFARGKPEANWAYHLYRWYFGRDPEAIAGAQVIFPPPTILMSGLMAAGPNLTPETFRDGLFRAKPTGGGATVPQVSFGDRGYWALTDYSGIDDDTEIWWDPEATGPDERNDSSKPGMYRYVDGGKRYLPGKWPDTPTKAFQPDGAVAIYETLPPSDQPPDYPKPNP